MKLNAETLALYLGNFVQGFADANQRRHLRASGWIAYTFKSWSLTPEGRRVAIERGLLEAA
jgi:hypothetical protein